MLARKECLKKRRSVDQSFQRGTRHGSDQLVFISSISCRLQSRPIAFPIPRALKSEADRLAKFLKPFLSSIHRGEPVSWAAPPPAQSYSQATAPPHSVASVRNRRLIGLWHYSPILRSGSASRITFRFRYFTADGEFAEGGESFSTFVRPSSSGQRAGIETLRSKVAPADRGIWDTTRTFSL